jgi:3-dehydroquinate dehydratase-2
LLICFDLRQYSSELWTNQLHSGRLHGPSGSGFLTNILVLNGPNLNLLGEREPDQYGQRSLAEIMQDMQNLAQACGLSLSSMQSNSEGELVDVIQQAGRDGVDYIIINPAGYTHTSVVIRDALLAVKIPFVEVHLSAVHAREPFRQISYFADIAFGVISGFRGESYLLALQAIINRIEPGQDQDA